MYLRTLIGPQAGEIQEFPQHAAEALLASGQAQNITREEAEAYQDEMERERRGDDLDEDRAFATRVESDAAGRVIREAADAPLAYRNQPVAANPRAVVLSENGLDRLGRLRELVDTPDDASIVDLALENLIDSFGSEQAPTTDEDGVVEIPADWEALHHSSRRALAAKITGETPADTAAADEAIRAELQRRDEAE